MGVLNLNHKRIFLEGICEYGLDSAKLFYRNENEEERLFFIWLMNEEELWSNYSFEYLYIKTFDGQLLKYYSDRKLTKLMNQMADFLEDIGDEMPEEYENLSKAMESYNNIKDNFIFVEEDISLLARKLDIAFGTL